MNIFDRIVNWFGPKPGEPRIYLPIRQAGVTVNEDTALTYSAVWACVKVISEAIAALPWNIYQVVPGGRSLVKNGVYDLLNRRPNPETSAFSFRETLVAHALTWGNGFAEIERDAGGRTIGLWIITPDRVKLNRTEDGRLIYEIKDDHDDTYTLTPERLLHVHGLGFDGVSGYSPVRMAARAVGVGIASDTFAASYFANGTHVGGTVEVDGNLTPDQMKLMEEYMNAGHRGPERAFAVKILGKGTTYKPFDMPLVDAQFLESRKFAVTDIARWFRVPPHKIADLDRSTNNNIEHQSIEFVNDTLVPWLVRLEQEINTKLIVGSARNVQYSKLDARAVLRGDLMARANYYRLMTQMGVMSINEVRELEEMNGIGPDGDERLVQINMTTLEKLVAEPPESAMEADEALEADGESADPTTADPEPAGNEPAGKKPGASNVIREEALEFLRQQRRHA
jgi:HK97 family phage portal protein